MVPFSCILPRCVACIDCRYQSSFPQIRSLSPVLTSGCFRSQVHLFRFSAIALGVLTSICSTSLSAYPSFTCVDFMFAVEPLLSIAVGPVLVQSLLPFPNSLQISSPLSVMSYKPSVLHCCRIRI